MMVFDDVLSPDAVCLGLEAESAAQVIEALAARLLALGKVRPTYAAAVLAREDTMPTGLPLGTVNIAVPHTDPVHVASPAIAVAVLQKPVSFGSMDDPDERLPVQIVIALALTDKDAQLAMLQRVAGFIQNPDALEALLGATTPGEAIAAFDQIRPE